MTDKTNPGELDQRIARLTANRARTGLFSASIFSRKNGSWDGQIDPAAGKGRYRAIELDVALSIKENYDEFRLAICEALEMVGDEQAQQAYRNAKEEAERRRKEEDAVKAAVNSRQDPLPAPSAATEDKVRDEIEERLERARGRVSA